MIKCRVGVTITGLSIDYMYRLEWLQNDDCISCFEIRHSIGIKSKSYSIIDDVSRPRQQSSCGQHGAHRVLSAPDGLYVGPMNLAIGVASLLLFVTCRRAICPSLPSFISLWIINLNGYIYHWYRVTNKVDVTFVIFIVIHLPKFITVVSLVLGQFNQSYL